MSGDPFYSSRRWRAVRLRALRRDGWRCRSCGGYGNEVHHVHPRREGGADYALSNLETLCFACHDDRHEGRRKPSSVPGADAWRALRRARAAEWRRGRSAR